MREFGDKLRSERGVSLLYGLMFFLVASLVAMAIVSAAVSAAERVSNDRARQQSYLALSSAGSLIADCLKDEDFYCTITTTLNGEGTDDDRVAVATQGGPLHDQIQQAMEDATGAVTDLKTDGDVPRAGSGSFTVQVPDSPAAGELAGSTVNVQYTLQERQVGEELDVNSSAFKIGAELSLANSDQKLYLAALRATSTTPDSGGEGITVEKVAWSDVTLSTRREVLT